MRQLSHWGTTKPLPPPTSVFVLGGISYPMKPQVVRFLKGLKHFDYINNTPLLLFIIGGDPPSQT